MPRPNRFNPGTLDRLSNMRLQQRKSRNSALNTGQSLNEPRLPVGYYAHDDSIPIISNRMGLNTYRRFGLNTYREIEARIMDEMLHTQARPRERPPIRQIIGIGPPDVGVGESMTAVTTLITDSGRYALINSAPEIVTRPADPARSMQDDLTSAMVDWQALPTLEKQPKYHVVNTDEIDRLIDEEVDKAIKESTKEWLRTVGRRAVLKHFTVHPTSIKEVSNVTEAIQKHVTRGFPLCNIAFSTMDLNLFRRVIRYLEHDSTKVLDPSRFSYKDITKNLLPAFEKEQKRLIEERERQEFINAVWCKRADRGFFTEFKFDGKDYVIYKFQDAMDFIDEHRIQKICLDKSWYYEKFVEYHHLYLSVMDCERQKAVLSMNLVPSPTGHAYVKDGRLEMTFEFKVDDIKSSKNINPIKYAELARHLECVLGVPGIGVKYINGMHDPDARLRFNPRFLDDPVALTTDHLIHQQQQGRILRPGHGRALGSVLWPTRRIERLHEHQISAIERLAQHSQVFPVDGTIETRGT